MHDIEGGSSAGKRGGIVAYSRPRATAGTALRGYWGLRFAHLRLKYGRPSGASNALSTPNTSPRLDTILAFGALNFAAGTFLLDTFEAEIGIISI